MEFDSPTMEILPKLFVLDLEFFFFSYVLKNNLERKLQIKVHGVCKVTFLHPVTKG